MLTHMHVREEKFIINEARKGAKERASYLLSKSKLNHPIRARKSTIHSINRESNATASDDRLKKKQQVTISLTNQSLHEVEQ